MPDGRIELPQGLRALGPEVVAHLDDLVARAERRQDRELRDALRTTLRLVPGPLRGVVKKVLLG